MSSSTSAHRACGAAAQRTDRQLNMTSSSISVGSDNGQATVRRAAEEKMSSTLVDPQTLPSARGDLFLEETDLFLVHACTNSRNRFVPCTCLHKLVPCTCLRKPVER